MYVYVGGVSAQHTIFYSQLLKPIFSHAFAIELNLILSTWFPSLLFRALQ